MVFCIYFLLFLILIYLTFERNTLVQIRVYVPYLLFIDMVEWRGGAK